MKKKKGPICPYCGKQHESPYWWADMVEKDGGGVQKCGGCKKWFNVSCKISHKWTSTKTEFQPKDP